jgi:hypothetical protein
MFRVNLLVAPGGDDVLKFELCRLGSGSARAPPVPIIEEAKFAGPSAK